MARTTRSQTGPGKDSDKSRGQEAAPGEHLTAAESSPEAETTAVADEALDPPMDPVAEDPEPVTEPLPAPSAPGEVMDPPVDPLGGGAPAADTSARETVEPLLAPPSEESTRGAPVAAAPAGRGIGALVLGGVLAAGLGAAAVLVALPSGWRGGAVDPALVQRIAALETRGAGLGESQVQALLDDRLPGDLAARLAALEAAPLDPGLADRLSALESAPGGVSPAVLEAALAGMDARLQALESGLQAQVAAAVDNALREARAAIESQAGGLAEREEDIAAAQARLAARAALAEVIAASESGVAVPGALALLPADPALAPFGEGLVTLARLQADYAPAARAALAAEPPAEGATIGERMASFLRAQTGARSLAPREGDDADAVLSRAEAALRAADLPGALTELDALSPTAAAPLAEWRAQAEQRLAALAALAGVQAQLERDGE